MSASNTRDCFREFIGKRVKGVLFDALPTSRRDLAAGNKTLVFEDGQGLTIASNGSYWIDSAEEVRRAINEAKAKLKDSQKEIRAVLKLAGQP